MRSLPKICHIGASHSAHVADLVRELDRCGYLQCVISFHKDSLIPKHIPVYFYPYHVFYPNKASKKQEKELQALIDTVMQREDPQIIHGHFLIYCCVALYMACEKYGLPTFMSPWSLRALANDSILRGRIQRCINLSDYFLNDLRMFSAFSSVYANLTEDMCLPQFRLPLDLTPHHTLEKKDVTVPRILSARMMQESNHQDLLIHSLPGFFNQFPAGEVTLIVGQHAPQGKPYFEKMRALAAKLGVVDRCRWISRGLSQDEFSSLLKQHNIVYSVADDPGCSQTTIQAAYSGAVTIVKQNPMENGILDHGVNTLRADLTAASVQEQVLYAAANLATLQPRLAANNRKFKNYSTEFTLPILCNEYDKIHSATEICRICGTPVQMDTFGKYQLTKCPSCEVRYHYPIPSDKFLKQWYSETETAKKWQGNILKAIDINHRQNVTNFSYYYALTKAYRISGKAGRALDIGCYSGCFLSQFAKDGYECIGIDVNSGFVEYGKQRFGLDLHCGDLQSFKFPDGHFDFVTFHQLLEHLQDPVVFFTEAVRVLAPGGCLQLSVPDAACNFKLSYPEHIYHFTEKTIRFLFDKFEIHGEIVKRAEQLAIIATGEKR